MALLGLLTTVLTTTSVAQTCTVLKNTAFGKPGFQDLNTTDPDRCCAACFALPNCGAWTINTEQQTCHLKGLDYGKVSHNKHTSSAIVRVTPTMPPTKPPTINPAPKGAKNVLFIISDDMRPSLGAYGLPQAVSPNLDKLARDGILFTRAHIQFSYCAPSRNSFMSGRRPDANKVYNFNTNFREQGIGDQWVALPEHFKRNGYLTTGTGKLYHPGVPPNFDQPRSWSPIGPGNASWPYLNSGVVNASDVKDHPPYPNLYGHGAARELKPDTFLLDQTVKNIAVSRLTAAIVNWKATGQPFFVGMGTHRPHLPWEFPLEFWNKTAPSSKIPLPKHNAWPHAVPHLGFHDCAEMSHPYYDDEGNGVPPDANPANFAAHQDVMRKAYYSCISYVDDLIGQLIDTLDTLGAGNDTAIVFTGDHGWHTGEHDMWCKMSVLELGTRVPLIFRAPWILKGDLAGRKSNALAELVDLYPTLSELAGLTLPRGAGGADLGGVSLVPVMRGEVEQVKNATLSQFPRCYQNNSHHSGGKPGDEGNRTVSWESMSDCHWTDRNALDFMGYKLRTANWSITSWQRWNGEMLRPIWGSDCGQLSEGNAGVGCFELYDHIGDDGMAPAAFDDYENVNLAADPAHAVKLKEMLALLKENVEKWITPWNGTTGVVVRGGGANELEYEMGNEDESGKWEL